VIGNPALPCRVAKLERAPGANGVDLRIYGSAAEAAADTRPVGPGTEMQIIVTGVVRAPASARASRHD
jgi:hypothetical protein